jgi:hypothetical protein
MLVEGEQEFVEGVEVALGEGDGELREGRVRLSYNYVSFALP